MNYCNHRGSYLGREVQCSNLVRGEMLFCYAHDPARVAERKRAKVLAKAAPRLLEALRAMVEHTDDLEEAWLLGALVEHDGLGGIRSNRNIDVNRQAKAAIAEAEKEE